MHIQQKLTCWTVTAMLISVTVGCSASESPQATPPSPSTTPEATQAPGAAQVNRVRSKLKEAQEQDAKRREQLP